jgi:hypothetical protein
MGGNAMPRFLIVTGILLAIAVMSDFLPGMGEPEIGRQTVKLDKAPPSVPNSVPPQVHLHAIEPAVHAATLPAPAAVTAEADLQADDALVSPSQTLSSASLDMASDEIDPSLVLLSPYEMTMAVQTELKRLACYDAKIDGVWGSRSRAAVRQFNERSESSFHLNESLELLKALKGARDGLCDSECSGSGNSCEIVATAEEGMEGPAQTAAQAEEEEAPSYLPPWMRGKQAAAVEDDSGTEVSEAYSSTHTSVSRRVYVKPRASRHRRIIRRRAERKEKWRPKNWLQGD